MKTNKFIFLFLLVFEYTYSQDIMFTPTVQIIRSNNSGTYNKKNTSYDERNLQTLNKEIDNVKSKYEGEMFLVNNASTAKEIGGIIVEHFPKVALAVKNPFVKLGVFATSKYLESQLKQTGETAFKSKKNEIEQALEKYTNTLSNKGKRRFLSKGILADQFIGTDFENSYLQRQIMTASQLDDASKQEILKNLSNIQKDINYTEKNVDVLLRSAAKVDSVSMAALETITNFDTQYGFDHKSTKEKIEDIKNGKMDFKFKGDEKKKNEILKSYEKLAFREDFTLACNKIQSWSSVGTALIENFGLDPNLGKILNSSNQIAGIASALVSHNYPGAILGALGMFGKKKKPGPSIEEQLIKRSIEMIENLNTNMNIQFDTVNQRLSRINDRIIQNHIDEVEKLNKITHNTHTIYDAIIKIQDWQLYESHKELLNKEKLIEKLANLSFDQKIEYYNRHTSENRKSIQNLKSIFNNIYLYNTFDNVIRQFKYIAISLNDNKELITSYNSIFSNLINLTFQNGIFNSIENIDFSVNEVDDIKFVNTKNVEFTNNIKKYILNNKNILSEYLYPDYITRISNYIVELYPYMLFKIENQDSIALIEENQEDLFNINEMYLMFNKLVTISIIQQYFKCGIPLINNFNKLINSKDSSYLEQFYNNPLIATNYCNYLMSSQRSNIESFFKQDASIFKLQELPYASVYIQKLCDETNFQNCNNFQINIINKYWNDKINQSAYHVVNYNNNDTYSKEEILNSINMRVFTPEYYKLYKIKGELENILSDLYIPVRLNRDGKSKYLTVNDYKSIFD